MRKQSLVGPDQYEPPSWPRALGPPDALAALLMGAHVQRLLAERYFASQPRANNVAIMTRPLNDKAHLGEPKQKELDHSDDGRLDLIADQDQDVGEPLPGGGERLFASLPASPAANSPSPASRWANDISAPRALPGNPVYSYRDGLQPGVEFWNELKPVGVAPELRIPPIMLSALKASNFANNGLFTGAVRFLQRPNHVMRESGAFENGDGGERRSAALINGFPEFLMMPPSAIGWEAGGGDKRSKAGRQRPKQRPTFDPGWQYIGLG